MREKIPYKKILRLALTTAPLMGLIGSTPIFVTGRIQFDRVAYAFLTLTIVIIGLWAVNIVLLKIGEGINVVWKDWLRYCASVILCLFVVYVVLSLLPMNPARFRFPPPGSLPNGFPVRPPGPSRLFLVPLLQSLSLNIIIIILMELVLLREKKQSVETENAQLKVANLEARHNRLRQQLHPHFLFNSLSILKSLINRSPSEAELYLERLSELLRYSTANHAQSIVALKEELDFCRNYLEMQQMRFGKALVFSFSIPETMKNFGMVPVYSVQLLIENAIKHNSLTVDRPLKIEIAGDANDNTISVCNNVGKKQSTDGRGIGLANLSERYNLLGKKIDVVFSDDEFRVTLKVLRSEDSNH